MREAILLAAAETHEDLVEYAYTTEDSQEDIAEDEGVALENHALPKVGVHVVDCQAKHYEEKESEKDTLNLNKGDFKLAQVI